MARFDASAAPSRRGCAASPRRRRRRSGRDSPRPGRPRRRPAGGRPRGPARSPGGSVPSARGRAGPRRAFAAPHRRWAPARGPVAAHPGRAPPGAQSRRSSAPPRGLTPELTSSVHDSSGLLIRTRWESDMSPRRARPSDQPKRFSSIDATSLQMPFCSGHALWPCARVLRFTSFHYAATSRSRRNNTAP